MWCRAPSLLEHLRALPAEEGDFGGDEVDGVLLDVGAVEAGDFRHRVAVEVAADEDGQVILEGEGAEIKKLVVQGAQREAILHDIGAVVRVPTDVRGLQPDDLVVQLEVVPANGAAVPVVAYDDGGKADGPSMTRVIAPAIVAPDWHSPAYGGIVRQLTPNGSPLLTAISIPMPLLRLGACWSAANRTTEDGGSGGDRWSFGA